MLSRNIAAAALASLCLAAVPAAAQNSDGAQPQAGNPAASFVTTFECASAMRPDQTTICSSPQLAAMDLQTQTLYTVVRKFLSEKEQADLEAGQNAFLNARARCGDDFQCIGTAYAQRIGQLDTLVSAAAEIFKREIAEDVGAAEQSGND